MHRSNILLSKRQLYAPSLGFIIGTCHSFLRVLFTLSPASLGSYLTRSLMVIVLFFFFLVLCLWSALDCKLKACLDWSQFTFTHTKWRIQILKVSLFPSNWLIYDYCSLDQEVFRNEGLYTPTVIIQLAHTHTPGPVKFYVYDS